MSFAAPILLLCLLVVPVAVGAYLLLDRLRERRAQAWAPASLQPNMVTRPRRLRRHLPTALLLAGVVLLLVGFARPQASFHVSDQQATIVLVVDVSGSMAARDLRPSRLAAARVVADRFVDRLPKGYRIAVVTFSDHSAVVQAPTHDLARAKAVLAAAHAGPQGTALAGSVARAVQVGAAVRGTGSGKRPPAVVVVLSDGGQTAGRVTPQQAVAVARKARIPVATALVGTPDGVVQQPLQGGFTERIQVPAQPATLRAIAQGSGGPFFSSLGAVDVQRVYRELGSRVGKRVKTIEVSAVAAGGGLVFMLAGALLSGLWFRRLV